MATFLKRIKSIQLPSSNKMLFWIVLAIILRGASALFFSNSAKKIFPADKIVNHIAVKQNDYYMFLGVIDTYFKTGTMSIRQGKPFAGRMPGYGVPYALFQFLFTKEMALTLLILSQILLSSLAVFYLAKTSFLLWENEKIFQLTFIIFGISNYTSIFDIFSLSESFAVSSIVFCVYFLTKYFKYNLNKYIILASFFMGWAIFLRPFLGILIALFSLIIFLSILKKYTFKKAFIATFLFCSCFVLMETIWIARNYKALNKFVPLETGLEESYGKYGAYRASAVELRLLINSWGGETGDFYDNSDAWWFTKAKGNEIKNFKFHSSVYKSGITQKQLIDIKYLYAESVKTKYSNDLKDTLNAQCIALIKTIKKQYLISNTFRSKVLVPIIRIKRFIVSNPTLAMPLPKFKDMNILEKGVKLYNVGLYFFILFVSIPAIFLARKKFTLKPIFYILLSIPLSLVLMFAFFGTAITENRYFLVAFPALIIFCSHIIVSIITRTKTS